MMAMLLSRSCFLVCVGCLISAVALFPHSAQARPYGVAVLQGVDKITGRISTIDVPLDTPVSFGTLTLTARVCDKKPPEETPESTAFIEITEQKQDEGATEIFRGWMFASSPAVSALEHPVYDVWVVDCKSEVKSQPSGSGSE